MRTTIAVLAAAVLLAGCASSRPAYTPTATTYGTTQTYVAPATTVYVPSQTVPSTTVYVVPSATYVPSTVYVPGTTVVPSTTYVPSASPGYFSASQSDCLRAGGI